MKETKVAFFHTYNEEEICKFIEDNSLQDKVLSITFRNCTGYVLYYLCEENL